MPVDLPTYIGQLQDLELIEDSGIDFHLEHCHNRSAEPVDAEALGQSLIEAGFITPWLHSQLQQAGGAELRTAECTLLDETAPGDFGALDHATRERVRVRFAHEGEHLEGERTPEGIVAQFGGLRSPFLVRPLRSGRTFGRDNLVAGWGGAGSRRRRYDYLIEEWGPGERLQQVVDRRGPLNIPEVVRVFRAASSGVLELHAMNLLHWDIRPSELIVSERGDKVSGYALYPWLGRQHVAGAPISGTHFINYLAPESLPEQPANVYSLGCTLCFALTGAPPYEFTGRTLAQILMQHQSDPVPNIRTRRADTPAWLARLCQSMLAKRPQERPSMAAVHTALERQA